MNKYIYRLAIITRAIITIVVAFTGGSIAQGIDSKKVEINAAPLATVQTVDARQSGAWTVGLDQTKNTVQLANTTANPLPVKVIGSGSARKPFQARVFVSPLSTGFNAGFLPIPAGKRLVIENVSAVGRYPEGFKMELNFFCYIDSNGDGVADISDIVFHRIPMIEQGVFQGTMISAGNFKVLAFADELIGTQHLQVVAQARLNGVPPADALTQAQLTFTGYLEDLP